MSNKIIEFLNSKKVELSSEKVDLGSVAILKDDLARMKKGINDLKALRKQMRAEYLKAIDKVSTHASDFNAKAKELGIKASEVKEYNQLFDLQRDLDDEYYKANNI